MKRKNKNKLNTNNTNVFKEGMKDGIPIALGYLAVSFSLGISAKNAGLNAFQGFIASFFTNASAGEYAAFTVIAADAPYFEMLIVTLIANARYLLMSCALSQKMNPELAWYHRLLIGFDVTDELFGITINRPGKFNPYYTYGAMILATPCWATGTMLGIIAGNVMPARLVSALSVALYGMFLAIIIPPCRKNKVVAVVIMASFALSYLMYALPFMSAMSSGTKTIILTIVISSIAALLFPIKKEGTEENDA